MSIFPFIDPEALAGSQDNALPMFREYAYDYENNRLRSGTARPTW